MRILILSLPYTRCHTLYILVHRKILRTVEKLNNNFWISIATDWYEYLKCRINHLQRHLPPLTSAGDNRDGQHWHHPDIHKGWSLVQHLFCLDHSKSNTQELYLLLQNRKMYFKMQGRSNNSPRMVYNIAKIAISTVIWSGEIRWRGLSWVPLKLLIPLHITIRWLPSPFTVTNVIISSCSIVKLRFKLFPSV